MSPKASMIAFKEMITQREDVWVSKREDFWASISDMLSQWPGPWCIGGDFNVVRFSYEKKGVDESFCVWSNFLSSSIEMN